MSKKARFSVIFIMTVFFLSLGLMAAGEITSTFAVSPAVAKQTVEEEPLKKEEYIVTLYEGELYLYRVSGGEKFLIKKADSPTPREEDILPLTEGIRSESLSSALSVFEDFIM